MVFSGRSWNGRDHRCVRQAWPIRSADSGRGEDREQESERGQAQGRVLSFAYRAGARNATLGDRALGDWNRYRSFGFGSGFDEVCRRSRRGVAGLGTDPSGGNSQQQARLLGSRCDCFFLIEFADQSRVIGPTASGACRLAWLWRPDAFDMGQRWTGIGPASGVRPVVAWGVDRCGRRLRTWTDRVLAWIPGPTGLVGKFDPQVDLGKDGGAWDHSDSGAATVDRAMGLRYRERDLASSRDRFPGACRVGDSTIVVEILDEGVLGEGRIESES